MKNVYFLLLFTIIAPLAAAEVESTDPEIVNQTLVWPDGTRYVGGVRDGKRWGKGTIFWQDGTRFVGSFANDLRNGPGTMILPDGTVYNGFFQDDTLVDRTSEPADQQVAVADVTPPVAQPQATAEPALDLQPETNQLALNTNVPPQPEPVEVIEATPDPGSSGITELTDSVRAEVESIVDLWASAWSERNVSSYLSHYSDEFDVPGRQTRRQWEALRRSRLTRPSTIDVTLVYEKFEITSPNVIEVEFDQRYRSNLYQDRTKKQLSLRKEGDAWRILTEKSI